MKSKLWLLAALFTLSLSGLALAVEEAGTMAADMKMDNMQMNAAKPDDMKMGGMDMNAVKSDEPTMNKVEGDAAKPAETILVGNKICPVSGEKIVMEKKGTIEYKGKTYNLCCSMCKKDFLKDPEKYIEKLKAMEASGEAGKEDADHDQDGDQAPDK